MLVQHALHLEGGDVLAAAPDAILLAATVEEVAGLVVPADIARLEPVALEERRRRRRIAPIARRDDARHLAAHPELAAHARVQRMAFLIDHAHLEIGKASADRAELAGDVLCGKTRAFGHSVAFANRDAET